MQLPTIGETHEMKNKEMKGGREEKSEYVDHKGNMSSIHINYDLKNVLKYN